MKITFDINRYNELLEKEKRLSQENNSLIFENKDEFIELLSYGARVKDQIFLLTKGRVLFFNLSIY